MLIYYCIQKDAKKAISAGALPEVWGTITGMQNLSAKDVYDLTWAGYPNHGFMSLADAQAFGIEQSELDAALELGAQHHGNIVKADRNCRLASTDWRFRSDQTPSKEWQDYCQALRDITSQPGFPWEINWPVEPQ